MPVALDLAPVSWKQNYNFKNWSVNVHKEIKEILYPGFQQALKIRDDDLAKAPDEEAKRKVREDFMLSKENIFAMADEEYYNRLLVAIEEHEGDSEWVTQGKRDLERIRKPENAYYAGELNVAGPSNISIRAYPSAGPSMASRGQPRLVVPPVNIQGINEGSEETTDDSSSGDDGESWESGSQKEPSVRAGWASVNNSANHGHLRSGNVPVPSQRLWIPPPSTEPAFNPARDRPGAPGNPARRVSVPPTGRPMSGVPLSRQGSLNSTYARPSPAQWGAPSLPPGARPPSSAFTFRPGVPLGEQPRAMQGSVSGSSPTQRRNERPQRGPPAPLEGWTPPAYNADPHAPPVSQSDWTRWRTERAPPQLAYRDSQAWGAPTQQGRYDSLDAESIIDLEYEQQNLGPRSEGRTRPAQSNAMDRQDTTLEEDINRTLEEAAKKAAESNRMKVEAMQRERQAWRAEERVSQREHEVRARELDLSKKQGDVSMREAKVLVKEEAIKQQEVELERKRQEAQAAFGTAIRDEVAEDEARLREKQKRKEEELERKEIELRQKEMDLRWKEEEMKKREEGLNHREAAISLREEQEEQRKAEVELKRRAEKRKHRAEEDRRRLAQARNGMAEEENRKILEEQRAKDTTAERDREAAEQRQREKEQRRSEEQKEREGQEARERNLGPSPEHYFYRQPYVRHAAALKRVAATANVSSRRI